MGRLRPALPLVALVFVLIATVQLFETAPVREALASARLTMPHDRFTSVELLDHTAIPAFVTAGTSLRLRVRVTNRQNTAMNYTVVPRLVNSTRRELQTATVERISVPDRTSVTVPVSISLPRCAGRIRAEIFLLGRREKVHALVTVQSSARPVVRCG